MSQNKSKRQVYSKRGEYRNEVTVENIGESLGKLPPQATDLEEAVLGAILLETGAISAIDLIDAEDFYVEAHQIIFQACIDQFRASEPIDMRTIVARLRKEGTIDIVGGPFKIAELTSKVSSAANIEYHARIVKEKSIKRKLIKLASKMHLMCYEDTTDVFEVLDEFNTETDKIARVFFSGNIKSATQIVPKTIHDLIKSEKTNGITGIPSGFIRLDKETAGWQNTDLVIIAARPGMGKTAFIVNAMRNASIDHGIPVAMFSLEMGNTQLIHRMLSAETDIDIEKIRRNELDNFEKDMLMNRTSKLQSAPFYIDDSPGLTLLELKSRARKLKYEKGIKLLIIDYLQLMTGNQGGNREQEISSISRGLKKIAKELEIPVIALSQLGRGVETRGGAKIPQLSDLRESGSIEQDADIVGFLYRPEYYKIDVDENNIPTKGVMEVIIAKFRNGSTTNVPLKFIGRCSKVTDWTDDYGQVPKQAEPTPEARLPYVEKPDDEDLPF